MVSGNALSRSYRRYLVNYILRSDDELGSDQVKVVVELMFSICRIDENRDAARANDSKVDGGVEDLRYISLVFSGLQWVKGSHVICQVHQDMIARL